MTNCYNAGKIGDLTKEVWEAKFKQARAEILKMRFNPICPTELPHNHGRTWGEYMKEDLTAMLGCDAVYAQRDWEDSPGATIEVNLAIQLGIPVYYQP